MSDENTARIPAGTYRARGVATSEQYGTTQTGGTEQIAIDLELLDLGERLTTFLYFSEKAAPYSIQRLRALGWTGDDLTDLEGIDANEVTAIVKYEMYQGESKMKVEILTAGGKVKLQKQMDEKEKRAFGARFRSLTSSRPASARTDMLPPSYDQKPSLKPNF